MCVFPALERYYPSLINGGKLPESSPKSHLTRFRIGDAVTARAGQMGYGASTREVHLGCANVPPTAVDTCAARVKGHRAGNYDIQKRGAGRPRLITSDQRAQHNAALRQITHRHTRPPIMRSTCWPRQRSHQLPVLQTGRVEGRFSQNQILKFCNLRP